MSNEIILYQLKKYIKISKTKKIYIDQLTLYLFLGLLIVFFILYLRYRDGFDFRFFLNLKFFLRFFLNLYFFLLRPFRFLFHFLIELNFFFLDSWLSKIYMLRKITSRLFNFSFFQNFLLFEDKFLDYLFLSVLLSL